MNSVLRKKKKNKEKDREKESKAVKQIKKSHSLTDLSRINDTQKNITNPDVPLNSKDNGANLFIRKYAHVSKEENKTLSTQAQPILFTTQQENFNTINENCFNTDIDKPMSPMLNEYHKDKGQLEIIVFEDEQEKTSNRMPNILNQFKDDAPTKKDAVSETASAKEKKLQKECFFNEPMYISKNNVNMNKSEINPELIDVRFKSLQLIHSNKMDQSFEMQPTPKTPGQNDVENSISQRMDKSIVNCLICFDKTPDSVFMECGHGGKFFNDLCFLLTVCIFICIFSIIVIKAFSVFVETIIVKEYIYIIN